MVQDRRYSALREFAQTISNPFEIGDVLYRLNDTATDILEADGAGIMLMDGAGELQFVTATDSRTAQVEQLQDALGDGPCYQAFRTSKRTLVEDLAAVDAWDDLPERAMELGFGSIAGLPLRAHGQTIGALNVYRNQTGKWSDEHVEAAELLADIVSGYILSAQRLEATRALADQLQIALDSRVIIEQAKGALSVRLGTDVQAAFDLLRRYARGRNLHLHDVAHRVVHEGLDVSEP